MIKIQLTQLVSLEVAAELWKVLLITLVGDKCH